MPLTTTICFLGNLKMFAKPSPEAYKALSLVVQIFKPRTMIAGIIRPCSIMTSETSATPKAIAPIAPNRNIRELPMKKAITAELTADLGLLAKRVKSGVKVPALINDPTQMVSAKDILIA